MIDSPFREFVLALAAKTPAPAGGAAAASAGMSGAALLAMVLRFTIGRGEARERDADLSAALAKLDGSIDRMLPMVERDMASFEHVAAAYKLPHDSDDLQIVRTRAIQEALSGAMVVPEELLHLSRDALAAMAGVVDHVGRSIVADLGAGAELLLAAVRSAELLVRINARYLHDRELARGAAERAAALLDESIALRDRLLQVVEERLS